MSCMKYCDSNANILIAVVKLYGGSKALTQIDFCCLTLVILRVQLQMQLWDRILSIQYSFRSNLQNSSKPTQNAHVRHENAFSRIAVTTLEMLSVLHVYFFYPQSLNDIRLHRDTCDAEATSKAYLGTLCTYWRKYTPHSCFYVR